MLETQIEEIVQEILPSSDYYIVNIAIKGNLNKQKIEVLLDTDEGISINACAKISRKLGNILEEKELIDNAYTLEVSSPGVDVPLKTERQYQRNVGKDVQVNLKNDKLLMGKLEEVDPSGIRLIEIVYKGKIKSYKKEATTVKFDEIIQSKVLISFK
jgi:ribosome maturation factor RimP